MQSMSSFNTNYTYVITLKYSFIIKEKSLSYYLKKKNLFIPVFVMFLLFLGPYLVATRSYSSAL